MPISNISISNANPLRLSDAQLIVLSRAAQRDDRRILPPSDRKGVPAARLIAALLAKGLIVEASPSEAAGDRRYVVSDTGLQMLGIEPADRAAGSQPQTGSGQAADETEPSTSTSTSTSAGPIVGDPVAQSKPPRAGSKLDMVIGLLWRPRGASIPELTQATGWQPHTTRAALVRLRQRGHAIERSRDGDGPSRYRTIATAKAS